MFCIVTVVKVYMFCIVIVVRVCILYCDSGKSVYILYCDGRYSDSLRAGRSGVQIPVGDEIFRTRPDRPWGPPSLLYSGYRLFPGVKAAGAWP